MNFTKRELRRGMLLYAVTDRAWLGGRALVEDVETVLKNGATFIQLREKELDEATFLKEAVELRGLCARYHVPFVVNDNIEIAIESGADGVHVGQSDIVGKDVRAMIGPDKILGISANSVETARAAQAAGADYIGVGAVFPTATKRDADDLNVQKLREICAAVDIPVVAIGGIGAGNIMELSGSGVDGVAVVSALFAARDIAGATRELLKNLRKWCHSMDKKFCIFDMDGTLVDSMGYWCDLGRDYLRSKGVEADAAFLRHIQTMTMLGSAAYIMETFSIPGPPQRIVDDMHAVMAEHYRRDVPLKPGMLDYLENLKQRGCRMCVATATAAPLALTCLERLGVMEYFDFLLSCEEVGVSKRSPDIYLESARRMGAAPREVAVFEDALFAARTAKEAGFYVVAVQDENCAGEWPELSALAHETVTDWRDARRAGI